MFRIVHGFSTLPVSLSSRFSVERAFFAGPPNQRARASDRRSTAEVVEKTDTVKSAPPASQSTRVRFWRFTFCCCSTGHNTSRVLVPPHINACKCCHVNVVKPRTYRYSSTVQCGWLVGWLQWRQQTCKLLCWVLAPSAVPVPASTLFTRENCSFMANGASVQLTRGTR